MGFFESPEQKWVKQNKASAWNRMFTGFTETDVMITKLMVYECVNFADKLLSSHCFQAQNQALRIDTILLAKMQFYHLVTKSQTVHNLFYAYIYELWVNHYQEDIETAHDAIARMHSNEKLYLMWYYDFYESKNGDLKNILREYCGSASMNKTTNDMPVLAVSKEDLRHQVALGLSNMHISFINKMRPFAK